MVPWSEEDLFGLRISLYGLPRGGVTSMFVPCVLVSMDGACIRPNRSFGAPSGRRLWTRRRADRTNERRPLRWGFGAGGFRPPGREAMVSWR